MRILVVEDDRLLNNTLCYNLNTAGYAVDSALTKSAAGSFLTEQDYDLIVLDVNLPDGNGFDFCREVKERRPDTAIIFLTANDMESDMLKGYELGAEDYVTKPFPIPIYSVFRKMVPYAAFSYPVIPLLSVAAIVLLVCFVTPVITFKQGVKESVVERLRQN